MNVVFLDTVGLLAVWMEDAWASHDQGQARRAGIVDYVSFQVMRRLGITDAFTNDKIIRLRASQFCFETKKEALNGLHVSGRLRFPPSGTRLARRLALPGSCKGD